jgi:hypothetical protein
MAINDDIGNNLIPTMPYRLPDVVPDDTNGLQLHVGRLLSHFPDLKPCLLTKRGCLMQTAL